MAYISKIYLFINNFTFALAQILWNYVIGLKKRVDIFMTFLFLNK